jgi:hypothetical protein
MAVVGIVMERFILAVPDERFLNDLSSENCERHFLSGAGYPSGR